MTYLVWSHEHGGWWRPGSFGYSPRLSEAARMTRVQALAVCKRAMPGAREALNELPVRLDDIEEMLADYRERFPDYPEREGWR